ncbi:MAG TPA: HlyD family efflux transporter periplasmic adaptor subunit [Bryobacteraceae bacterium]
MSESKRARRWISLTVVFLIAGLASAGVYRMRHSDSANNLPMAPARKGDFSVIVRCRGELKARRSVQITAPVNVPDLRIVWAAPPSSPVKSGDVVIRFDPSSAKQQLQEKEATLRQAQATLDQQLAQTRISAEQDQLDLATSRYQVEKAKLETSKAEIVSALQGEESKIDLGIAEKDLRVKEANMHLHAAANDSKTASMTRLRDHAQSDVDLTKRRLDQMEITSPLTGLIIYMPNYSQGWMNAKPFKVGDQVWPGASVAEIPDLNTLEMEGKIEEIDRGRIVIGNNSRVRIDSLPELTLPAKLSGLSPLTEQTFEWPPTSSFRGYSLIQKPDPRLRPGMNGSMDIEISRVPAAISVPSKALFTRNGKPVVYLAGKSGYHAVEVQILARNPDEIAIHGIDPGSMVALVDPEKKDRKQ